MSDTSITVIYHCMSLTVLYLQNGQVNLKKHKFSRNLKEIY